MSDKLKFIYTIEMLKKFAVECLNIPDLNVAQISSIGVLFKKYIDEMRTDIVAEGTGKKQ